MKETAYFYLSDLADIKAGYPFRGAVTESPGGVPVVRIKDLRVDGPIDWAKVMETELTGRRVEWLQNGDILFISRGDQNLAYCLSGVPEQAVCTPHFFQIHVKPETGLLPEFLAWQINQKPAQEYLERSAQGTALVRNIPRQILEQLKIVVPPLEKQKQVLALQEVVDQERKALECKIKNGHRMIDAVAKQILEAKQEERAWQSR